MLNYFLNLSLACLIFAAAPFMAMSANAQTPTAVSWETDIQPIVNANCLGCHSANIASGDLVLETKEQVLKAKTAILNQISKGLMPADQTDWNKTADGITFTSWLTTQITYDADIKPILSANCTSCHSGSRPAGRLNFEDEAQVNAASSRIAVEVKAGKMPPRNKTWKDSAQAKILLDWVAAKDAKPATEF